MKYHNVTLVEHGIELRGIGKDDTSLTVHLLTNRENAKIIVEHLDGWLKEEDNLDPYYNVPIGIPYKEE